MTVTVRSHFLHDQTICIDCAGDLGITDWGYRGDEVVPYILGTAPPPRGSKSKPPGPEEVLRRLSSGGFMLPPRPKPVERIDPYALLDAISKPEIEASVDEAA